MSDWQSRYQRLLFDRPHPLVLRVTMNRPEKYNALNVERLAVSSLVFGEEFKTEVAATRARLAKRKS